MIDVVVVVETPLGMKAETLSSLAPKRAQSLGISVTEDDPSCAAMHQCHSAHHTGFMRHVEIVARAEVGAGGCWTVIGFLFSLFGFAATSILIPSRFLQSWSLAWKSSIL